MAMDKKIFKYLENHNMEMPGFLSKLVQIDSTNYEANTSLTVREATKMG